MDDPQFADARRRREEVEAERRRLLYRLGELADEQGPRMVIRTLIARVAQGDPIAMGLRLWRIDNVMFSTPREKACYWIRKARVLAGDRTPRADGFVTLGWALEGPEQTVRMSAWLWVLMKREDPKAAVIRVPDNLPFSQIYATTDETTPTD